MTDLKDTKTVHLPEGDWVTVPLTEAERLSSAEAAVRKQRGKINSLAAKLDRLAAINAELVEALDWAVAEVECRTNYTDDLQCGGCLKKAKDALSKARGQE